MKSFMYIKRHILIAITIVISLCCPMIVQAEEAPYTSITVDKDGYLVRTVDGYIPGNLWDKIGETELSKPSDLFLSSKNELYIADTGNKRIVICDLEANFLREITGELKGPTGVFVTEDGWVYIADPAAKKIFVYTEAGQYVKEFDTPVSPLFGENAKYAPTKIVVNNAKTIYALSEGNSNGILNISDHGDFYGYFGANETTLSVGDRIKRIFFTEEQMKSMQKNVPSSACNLDIDSDGLIYTVTQGSEITQIKKYSMAGNNMFNTGYRDNLLADIAVGNIENIYTLSKDGYIYEYTRDGNLLFCFAGKDDGKKRTGLFVNAAAIEVDANDNLYVLDKDRGDITVFNTTEYANTVHKSLSYYQDGFYLESKEPWEQVLTQNSLFDYAYRGIGEAQYKLEDYRAAMDAARLGGAERVYSNAFWQQRNIWIRQNVIKVFWAVVLLVVFTKIWKKFGDSIPVVRQIKSALRKFRNFKFIKEISFLKYVLHNPADAFYGIKHEGKVSVFTATIVYMMVFIIYVVDKYCCGFLFKTVPDGQYDLAGDLVKVIGVMLLFVVCNNLICSIRDGEATFKQNYCSFVYCFMPYIFLKPVSFVLTHVLTYNEQFLISFLNFVMIAGTAILIVVMIREIQCYTYKQTFINILLTLFTMLIVVAAGFIVFALMKQVVDFMIGIYKEAYYRGR